MVLFLQVILLFDIYIYLLKTFTFSFDNSLIYNTAYIIIYITLYNLIYYYYYVYCIYVFKGGISFSISFVDTMCTVYNFI